MAMRTWTPTQPSWGDKALREVKTEYAERLLSRVAALCVWAVAKNPGTTLEQVERLAQEDVKIAANRETECKVAPGALEQARKIVGRPVESSTKVQPELPAAAPEMAKERAVAAVPGAESASPKATPARGRATAKGRRPSRVGRGVRLSKIQRALLSKYKDSTKLVENYLNMAAELELVEAAYAKARAALRELPQEHAVTLAEIDPSARAALEEQGVLADEGGLQHSPPDSDDPQYVLDPDEDA